MTLETRGKSPRDLADQKKILIIRGRSSEDPVDYGQNIPRIGQPRSNYLHTLLIRGGSFKIQILWQSTLRSYHNMVGSKFLLWQLLQKVIPIKANHLKIPLIRVKSLQSSFKYCGRSLQGVSINVRPTFIYNNLDLGPLHNTRLTIQLENKSNARLTGVVEDVLVQVNDLIFPDDFYITDMEGETKSESASIILDRPFIKIAKTKMDIDDGTMSMEFGDIIVKFNTLML
ncbi:hypothetical protein KIW84_053191 [Lathyrus oleraceus]|uniref:Uncharacterized protein n=1 Tax=Pisum sativum TaxID=3888 RepID=A0A9D4WPT1_PEA|nr:hypothetical protein KIW84_053191 [Pisum sativum]